MSTNQSMQRIHKFIRMIHTLYLERLCVPEWYTHCTYQLDRTKHTNCINQSDSDILYQRETRFLYVSVRVRETATHSHIVSTDHTKLHTHIHVVSIDQSELHTHIMDLTERELHSRNDLSIREGDTLTYL